MLKVANNNEGRRTYQDVKSIYFHIKQKTKTFSDIVITKIYKGEELIWNLIKSCFGSGVWVNLSTWSNTETWKN